MLTWRSRGLLPLAVIACTSTSFRTRISRKLVSVRMNETSGHFCWKDLDVNRNELSLDLTLNMGQCFNWKKMNHTKEPCWIGLLAHEPIIMKQSPFSTQYLSLMDNASPDDLDLHQSMKKYYQLDSSLSSLYAEWGLGCGRMKEVTRCLEIGRAHV